MQTVYIDYSAAGIPPRLHAVQGDAQSRYIRVILLDGGWPYQLPEGAIYVVQYRGTGNNFGVYDAIELADGTTRPACVAEGNAVAVELASAMLTQKDTVALAVQAIDQTGYRLATWPMTLEVEALPVPDGDPQVEPYISAGVVLAEAAALRAEAVAAQFEEDIADIQATLSDLQTEIDNLHDFDIVPCTAGMFDPVSRVPTVASPKEYTLYLVPTAEQESGNLWVEWVYTQGAWERFTAAKLDLSTCVPDTRTVNGKALSANISLTAEDVGARADDWMPTAAQVGARPSDWVPSAADVGARPANWTPTAGDISSTDGTVQAVLDALKPFTYVTNARVTDEPPENNVLNVDTANPTGYLNRTCRVIGGMTNAPTNLAWGIRQVFYVDGGYMVVVIFGQTTPFDSGSPAVWVSVRPGPGAAWRAWHQI